MKNGVLLLLGIFTLTTSFSQSAYWQQRLHYILEVSLNDQDHSLDGFLKLTYENHSPDTLRYIWFHLWPNATKNDKTAFSEQLLENGNTRFYFSSKEQRGYLNRLDFRIKGASCKTEDHPQHIDILKVYLDEPLLPGAEVVLTTPFHVQLPENFSRGGHVGKSYQVTQWYPKPAVYDARGWHPMPYLDQGEFYSEFGDYDVRITVPADYVVAAGAIPVNPEEKSWLLSRSASPPTKPAAAAQPRTVKKTTGTKPIAPAPSARSNTRTLHYQLQQVHDFAWFADKQFILYHDTAILRSGRIVELFSYYSPASAAVWKNSIRMMKAALHFRSNTIGEYPYPSLSAVEAPLGFEGGMEYPAITSISPQSDAHNLELILEHEIGHNWFYGVLANNERDHPWMDEGINTYYDLRYEKAQYPQKPASKWGAGSLNNLNRMLLATLAELRRDQPIATPSTAFTTWNYNLIAYYKTAYWLQKIENHLGTPLMDSCMKVYFETWKFRHPQPEDFLQVMESTSGQKLDSFRRELYATGPPRATPARQLKPAFLLQTKYSPGQNTISFLPVPGYNQYDGFLLGPGLHNLQLPPNRLTYLATTQYGTRSRQWNGLAGLNYRHYPNGLFRQIDFSLLAERYSNRTGTDSNGHRINGHFYKVAPSVRWTLATPSPRSTRERWISYKLFLTGEQGFTYVRKSADGLFYPQKSTTQHRYINQLTVAIVDYRALYPFEIRAQAQQGSRWYRLNLTANYILNYPQGGGASIRFFAAKFGYLGGKTLQKQLETFNFQPKLTAVRGSEDYTYSNYFFGRNDYSGLAAQQIMIRDGGLKLRTDLFQDLQGRSDNWVAAVNFNTTLPYQLLPRSIPLRVFFDAGTFAEAWKRNSATPGFLFAGGLQLSLLKGMVNIYAPLFYSRVFADNLKSVPEENKFGRKISFSIDLQRFNLRRITGNQFPF